VDPAKTFPIKVITPEGVLVDEPAAHAQIPAHDGLFGVLPGRAPIVAELGLGQLRVDLPGGGAGGGRRSRVFLVEDGFAQVSPTGVRVLASSAVEDTELSEADARAELAEAEARTVPADHPDPAGEQARIQQQRRRARMALQMIQKRSERAAATLPSRPA
jgi:F-type H+-transporting ATPase subunit epsilon